MHIDRIAYQKTFNIGSYQSERIGVEIVLNEGDSAKEALDTARNLVHEYHQETAPLEEMRGTITRDVVDSPEGATIKAIINDMAACTAIDEKNNLGVQVGLLSYEGISKEHPELSEYYKLKFDDLSTNKTK